MSEIEYTGEWRNCGDLNYKRYGTVFIQLVDEVGEPSANVIKVFGWENLEPYDDPRQNGVQLHCMMLLPEYFEGATHGIGEQEWARMSATERAYAAAEYAESYTNGWLCRSQGIDTPRTKGVDHFIQQYKDLFKETA